jgi:hypothetical protein
MIPINVTQIGDALSNPTNIISICALTVSIASILIGYYGLKRQRIHDELSVRPICNVGTIQGPLVLTITILNNGVGPMIIKSVETHDSQGNKKDYPMDWIPLPDRQFVWRDLENVAILNGKKIDILGFNFVTIIDGKPKLPITKDQIKKREEIRSILKDLTIHIKYTDIYGKEQPEYKYSFSVFGQKLVE